MGRDSTRLRDWSMSLCPLTTNRLIKWRRIDRSNSLVSQLWTHLAINWTSIEPYKAKTSIWKRRNSCQEVKKKLMCWVKTFRLKWFFWCVAGKPTDSYLQSSWKNAGMVFFQNSCWKSHSLMNLSSQQFFCHFFWFSPSNWCHSRASSLLQSR